MKHGRNRGYTFIEILLAVVVMMAATVGIYTLYQPAMLKAGVEKEQRHLSAIVSSVQGGFGRTQGTYAGLNNRELHALNGDGVYFTDDNTLVSRMGDNVLVRPATVKQYGDAFDVVYQGLNKKKCLAYVKTFFPQSYAIYVGSVQEQIQNSNDASDGRLTDDTILYAACLADEFATNQGVVVFRFYEPMILGGGALDPACGCTPETQEQALPCGPAQSGAIYQERTSACSGGTPACPTPVWSAWSTTNNTCSGVAVPLPPSTPVSTPLSPCIPTTETQNSACPVGERGQITERRSSTCATPTSVPMWSVWSVVQNTCAAPSSESASCVMGGSETQNAACPAGQIGAVVLRRTSDCSSPFAAPVYGPWVEVSRTCRVACADAGNCCQPLPHQYRPLSCPAGQWGAGTERRTSWCDAVNPSSPITPNWNAWLLNTGAPCVSCPAPSTATETRFTAQTGACGAGQYGSTSWDQEESRSQTTTYNCPAGTQALPPPTIAPWTGWTATGATQNNASSCVACPANTSATETDWVADAQACPVGQVGTHTFEREVTRTRSETYSCPAGTLTAPTPTVSFTPWTPTGALRNVVNTCAVPVCSGNASETQWIGANGTCPVGQTGSITWQKEQVRTRTCSSPPAWDAWSAWTDTGNTNSVVNTCVAASCTGNASETQWIAHNDPCPVGEAGTNSWEAEETRTRTCTTPPTWDAFGGWTETGARRNTVYTCAPVACAGLSSETQWLGTVGACDAGYDGSKTWEREQIRTRTCTTPPTWDAFGGWTDTGNTRNLVENCTASCVAPATTNTTVYINRANEPRTLPCNAGYTGTITQERTVQEIGTDTTTWSCPGPTPTNSTTWSGTYNYGAWVTVSDTCVAIPPPTFHYGCGFYGPNGPPSGFIEMNECPWDPSAYWQTDATVAIGTSFDGSGFPVLDETIYRVEMTSVRDGATCSTFRCNISVNMAGDYYSHTRIRVIRLSDNVEVFNEVLIVDFAML